MAVAQIVGVTRDGMEKIVQHSQVLTKVPIWKFLAIMVLSDGL